MLVSQTSVEGVHVIAAQPARDERGSFGRIWAPGTLPSSAAPLVVLSASWNPRRGTLRGMHWQEAPAEETKLVRCTRGRVHDVAVDVRPHSPGYLTWFGIELTAGDGQAVYLPPGVAHGFLTLEDDTEIEYLMTDTYDPSLARGLRHDDPAVAIDWMDEIHLVSPRDRGFPLVQP